MIVSGRVTNPGEMRTKVLLAPRTVSTETGGFQAPAPDTANQVSAWAKWTNAHGSEVWAAQAAGVREAATVLVRYQAGLDPTWYVSKDGGATWYEIVSVDDIGERHEYVELKVKKLSAG